MVWTLLTCGALVAAPTVWTHVASSGRIYPVEEAPARPVALVLGAGLRPDGQPGRFLQGRLNVALQLWQAGKVERFLVSGDNRVATYDEPGAMKSYLVAHGVPDEAVLTDPAGLDTYASCVRAVDVYGVTQVVVVSQTYHLPRALALCNAVGLDAIGVGDTSVKADAGRWWWGQLREIGANVKAAFEAITRPDPT